MMEKYHLKGFKSGSFTLLLIFLKETFILSTHPRCGFPEYFHSYSQMISSSLEQLGSDP